MISSLGWKNVSSIYIYLMHFRKLLMLNTIWPFPADVITGYQNSAVSVVTDHITYNVPRVIQHTKLALNFLYLAFTKRRWPTRHSSQQSSKGFSLMAKKIRFWTPSDCLENCSPNASPSLRSRRKGVIIIQCITQSFALNAYLRLLNPPGHQQTFYLWQDIGNHAWNCHPLPSQQRIQQSSHRW